MIDFLVIDSIADFSIINKCRSNIIDNYLLMLTKFLKNLNLNIKYINATTNLNFNTGFLKLLLERDKPQNIIISCNYNNIINIQHLIRNINYGINIYLFSRNAKEIKVFEGDNSNYKVIEFVENMSIDENLRKIINELNVSENVNLQKYSPDYWEILKPLKNYSIGLNIGTGCQRMCSYCNIKCSKIDLIDIELLKEEVKYVLNQGSQFFHILNHSLIYNIDYVKQLCNFIDNQFNSSMFSWSCFIVPEKVIKNLEIFKILKSSKLERIEIGVEHVNKQILKHYNISSSKQDIKKIVKYANEINFTSIAINYVIGSEFESIETLNELVLFSKELIEIAPGKVEFNLYYYFDENDCEKNITYSNANGYKKLYPLFTKSKIDHNYLLGFKGTFFTTLQGEMKKSLKNIDLNKRRQHFSLACNEFQTQYYIYFLSKSSGVSVRGATMKNPHLKYSWEINDDIFDYTPIVYTKLVYNNNKPIFIIDRLFYDKSFLELNEFEFTIYYESRGLNSLNEISESLIKKFPKKNPKEIKREMLVFFKKLEFYDILMFNKLLV
ncbi:MAG: radical SAM protein [Bacteroidales bacterium]|nr:radical SAM protein [Bacteroidales bacterium]